MNRIQSWLLWLLNRQGDKQWCTGCGEVMFWGRVFVKPPGWQNGDPIPGHDRWRCWRCEK